MLATDALLNVIQSAGLRDLLAIRRLQRLCFGSDGYDWLTLLGLFMNPRGRNLKAHVDSRLIGYVSAEINPYDSAGWIITLGVLPEFGGRGIGTALLQAAESSLATARVRLTVRVSNQRAIRLYERAGYGRVSVRSRYYADGEDGWVMEKSTGRRV